MQSKSVLLVKTLLVLAVLEGCLALVFSFREPSMDRNALLLGFSASRLAVGGAILLPLGALAAITLRAWLDPIWLGATLTRLDGALCEPKRLLALTVILGYTLAAGLAGAAVWNSLLPQIPVTARTVAERLQPVFLWALVLLVQLLVGLWGRYPALYRQNGFFQVKALLKTLFVLVGLTITGLHWAILALQLPVLTAIPGWYWQISPRGFSARDGVFLLLACALLGFAWFAARKLIRPGLGLAVLVIFGSLLQLSLGVMEGGGIEALRMRYAGTFHASYAMNAVQERDDVLTVLRAYEDRYGLEMFLGTKPPGLLLVYMAFDRIANGPVAEGTAEARLERVTTLLGVTLPLLSMLVLLAIYSFSKQVLGLENPLLPALFYITCPNVILFALYMDQALYPLLFFSGAMLITWAVRSRSFFRWMLAGVFLYLAVFLVFPMLALIAFTLALVGLDFLFAQTQAQPGGPAGTTHLRSFIARSRRPALILLGILAGFGLMDGAARVTFQYDIVTRYQRAMATVHNYDFYDRVDARPDAGEDPLRLRLRQIGEAAFLNNVDFAAGVGFPVFGLFLAGAGATLAGWYRSPGDARLRVAAALLATFLGLNLIGQMRGESARLWLFWAPFFACVAALGLQTIFRQNRAVVLAVVAMQLITLFLTYKFQDLMM